MVESDSTRVLQRSSSSQLSYKAYYTHISELEHVGVFRLRSHRNTSSRFLSLIFWYFRVWIFKDSTILGFTEPDFRGGRTFMNPMLRSVARLEGHFCQARNEGNRFSDNQRMAKNPFAECTTRPVQGLDF